MDFIQTFTGTVLSLYKENLFKHAPVHSQRLDTAFTGAFQSLRALLPDRADRRNVQNIQPGCSWGSPAVGVQCLPEALLTSPEEQQSHYSSTAHPKSQHCTSQVPARGEALQRGTANQNPPDTQMWFVTQQTAKPHLWISACSDPFQLMTNSGSVGQ